MARSLESRRLPIACFGVALAALLRLPGRRAAPSISFFYDDWELLVRRPGWSPAALLEPFHEHLIAGPALIYKTLQATLGMTSATPYFVVSMLILAIAAALLFAFLRTRVGEWLAFFAVLPVLFLGAASEDLFWIFQMCFFGSVAAGLGMLLALDRGDRLGDRIAAVLLVVSLAFSGVGIPFAAAAVVDVLLGPRPRRRRAYLFAVPLALYALWWIGWGHNAEHSLTSTTSSICPDTCSTPPGRASLRSSGSRSTIPRTRGTRRSLFRLLAIAVAIGVVVKIVRERRLSRRLAVVLAVAPRLLGAGRARPRTGRYPISDRFQYPSVVFILLVLGEALRGVRLPRVGLLAVGGGSRWSRRSPASRSSRTNAPTWESFGVQTRAVLAGSRARRRGGPPGFFISGVQVDVPRWPSTARRSAASARPPSPKPSSSRGPPRPAKRPTPK